jgi:hypothetical protein
VDTLPSGSLPASEALPPLLDMAPLIRAPEGLEPSQSVRCPAHTTGLSDFPCSSITGLCPQTSQSGLRGPLPGGEHGISRLPRKVFPYVPEVSDRAGSERVSRYRTRPVLPSAASHGVGTLNFNRFSRLHTRPARTPVNASVMASLPPLHDSGPVWFATPSPYDSLIHNTLPVLSGALGTLVISMHNLFRL